MAAVSIRPGNMRRAWGGLSHFSSSSRKVPRSGGSHRPHPIQLAGFRFCSRRRLNEALRQLFGLLRLMVWHGMVWSMNDKDSLALHG